jgi:hypothetical protein
VRRRADRSGPDRLRGYHPRFESWLKPPLDFQLSALVSLAMHNFEFLVSIVDGSEQTGQQNAKAVSICLGKSMDHPAEQRPSGN